MLKPCPPVLATKNLADQQGGQSSPKRYNLMAITCRHVSLHTNTLHDPKRPPIPSQVPVSKRYPERTVLAGESKM